MSAPRRPRPPEPGPAKLGRVGFDCADGSWNEPGFATPASTTWVRVLAGRCLAATGLKSRGSAVYALPGGGLLLARSGGNPSGDRIELVVGADVPALRAQLGDWPDPEDRQALDAAEAALLKTAPAGGAA